jgi:DNA gyrase subunit A
MRQPVAAIRTIGRVTQGVKLVKLDDGSSISSITRVISEEEATSQSQKENNQLNIDDAQDEPKES